MKNYTKAEIENRITKLKNKPVENAKLIRKWERMLRRTEPESES